MEEHAGSQINDLTSAIPCGGDLETEIVIRREFIDTRFSPHEESKERSMEKLKMGFENELKKLDINTDDLDKDEPVEDKHNFTREKECDINEIVGRMDFTDFDSTPSGTFKNDRLPKTFNTHVDKSPAMEFRCRLSNGEKSISQGDETGSVDREEKSYKKDDEGPVIKEEASEQRLYGGTGVKSKSFLSRKAVVVVVFMTHAQSQPS